MQVLVEPQDPLPRVLGRGLVVAETGDPPDRAGVGPRDVSGTAEPLGVPPDVGLRGQGMPRVSADAQLRPRDF